MELIVKFRRNISKDLEKRGQTQLSCGVVVALRVVTMSRPSGWGEHHLAGISSTNAKFFYQCKVCVYRGLPDVSYREVLFTPFKPRPQLKSDGNFEVVH